MEKSYVRDISRRTDLRGKAKEFFIWLGIFLLVLSVTGFEIGRVSGNSLSPKLESGNYFLYKNGKVRLGDYIVFSKDGMNMIKRVVGRQGDVVCIRRGNVFLNNRLIEDIKLKNLDGGVFEVKHGYFAVGYSKESIDSREFGEVGESLGRCVFIFKQVGERVGKEV